MKEFVMTTPQRMCAIWRLWWDRVGLPSKNGRLTGRRVSSSHMEVVVAMATILSKRIDLSTHFQLS